MQRSISLISLLAIIAALAFSSWLPTNNAASAGQGKGGEVVAKPTPAPNTKKTTTNRAKSGSRSSRPNTGADELAFWDTIKNSTDPEDFKAYLEQYPKGKFASLAKNRLKALEGTKSATKPPATNPTPAGPTSTNPGTTNPTSTNPGSPTPSTTNSSLSKRAMPPNPPLPLHSFDFVTVTLDKDGKLKNRETRSASAFTEDLGSGVKLEMVAIPPGEFTMGSGEGHRVRIGYWFYLGKFEVTRAQWRAVMGNDPARQCDKDECPVTDVSWNDAVEFCRKLSARTGQEYRLPSESEWEYAARAGTTTDFAFGDAITPEVANYSNKVGKPVAVGSFGVANAFGLYDMHGNLWEWCQDWYHDGYTAIAGDAPSDGSAWLTGGEKKYRVARGGAYHDSVDWLRSAARYRYDPDTTWPFLGLRVVAVARSQ